MKTFHKPLGVLFTFGLLVLASTGQARAFEIRSGSNVSVEADEVIKESVIVAGERVDVLGRVEGDVICAGQNVRISGEVAGDVICAGQNVEVSGIVEGDVRVAGQWIRIEGAVGKNVSAFGQNVDNRAITGGEMLAAGQNVDVSEELGGGLLAAGESVNVSGSVGGNARMWVNRLRLGGKSNIKGDLWYESENELENGGVVGGKVERVTPPEERSSKARMAWQEKSAKWNKGIKGASGIGTWLMSLILGLVLVGLWPKQVNRLTERMRKQWSRAMLTGLGVTVLVPVVSLIMMVTIVGIPFALSLLMVFAFALMLSQVWSGLALGQELVGRFAGQYKENKWITAASGITALCLLMAVPFLGWLVKCAATLWGMGGWWYLLRKEKKVKK